jgi:hypothetical protein
VSSSLEFLDAAVTVLQEEGKPLHWTVVQDLALKRGYLDPFTQRDIRKNLLAAVASGARTGVVVKEDKGIFRLP